MKASDIKQMDEGFVSQGWGSRIEVLEKYLREQENGTRYVVFAEVDGKAVGYATLMQNDPHGPFANQNLPVVVDFNVLEAYQRNGIGNEILARIEAKAAETSDIITLGVGMHPGYGPAQRLYIKRGYVPVGDGLWYRDHKLSVGDPCQNDDSLVWYMSKRLR